MISGVTIQANGQSHTLRMTTRAMMAIEQHFDKGLIEVMQGMEKGFKVSDLVKIISECADDGRGVSIDDAVGLVDEIGVTRAGELLGDVAEAAFPDAKGQAAKNAKRATQKQ